jgi:hypothetical protein
MGEYEARPAICCIIFLVLFIALVTIPAHCDSGDQLCVILHIVIGFALPVLYCIVLTIMACYRYHS